ncbi:MAG TPA: divalent-cation tolerance protein CutA [Nitrospirota bacterium]|jgi:periplasmic divalent cation tolerance protein
MKTEYITVIVTTAGEDDAAKIGRTLVDEKLAACANIVKGIRSIYRYDGEVFDEPECMMIIKTVAANFDAVEKRVRELHSYEVPEVIALPILNGSVPYLGWLKENTAAPA